MEETGMRRFIGKMIHTLREEAGISQTELAEGILNVADLSRVENGKKEEERFVLEALFQRLGKSTDLFEMLTSAEEYRILFLREFIMENLLDHNLQIVEELLLEYHENTMGQKSVHEQYFRQIRAVNFYLTDRDREKCIQDLLQAMAVTRPDEKWKKKNWDRLYFCTQEIQIFLLLGCLWTENAETDKAQELLEKIWEYLGWKITDEAEKVKLYPKCAWLLGELYYRQGKTGNAYQVCDQGKECLAKNGSLIVMDKLLALEEICLRELGREAERKVIENQLNAVEAIYRIADFKLPEDRILCLLFTNEHNEVLISNEMVRELRTACGLSQEKLSEGICSRETLTRIEKGQRSPNRKNLQAMFQKMGERREIYHSYIVTEDYELHEKVGLYKRKCYQKEWERAGEILKEVEEKLDMTNPVNRQFLENSHLSQRVRNKEIDYPEALQELEKILKYTMTNFEGEIYRIPYREEFIILNRIALYNRFSGNMKKAEQLYAQLLKKYRESGTREIHHNIPLFLLYINYTGLLETENKLEDAEIIGKNGMHLMVESQRGDVAANLLANISCIYDKKGTVEDDRMCEMCMRNSYWLQILYHLRKDSLVVKEAYEKKYANNLNLD